MSIIGRFMDSMRVSDADDGDYLDDEEEFEDQPRKGLGGLLPRRSSASEDSGDDEPEKPRLFTRKVTPVKRSSLEVVLVKPTGFDNAKEIVDNLNTYWCYLGADGNNLSFLHYANMLYSYFSKGAAIPKYRSHELSLAFEERIHELGGDIWFNSEVVKILTDEEGHVCGVRLKDGREIESRHVIANCSPHVVYGKLLDREAVPERALKLTNFRKLAGRGFTVFLGISKSAEELGLKDHNYFVYDTADNVKQYESMKTIGNTAAQATVVLNNADPDCSPEGTCIIYMTTLFTDDAWSSIEKENYFKVKNKVAASMIERFEKATGASIHDHIEEIAIATPETYARYCGHPQGTVYGYESQYYDGLMSRIQMVEEDRFVPGLRIGGGYGERLLGFPSSYKSGVNEAGRTLRDMEKEGR